MVELFVRWGSCVMLRLKWKVLILALLVVGCRRATEGNTLRQYVENGRQWAYGLVRLTDLSGDFSIMIRRQAGAQPLVTFSLEGRQGSDVKDVAYVDYHPQEDEVLAYVHSLEFRSQDGLKGEVYAVLEKGGRSSYGRQYVHVGVATFENQQDLTLMRLDQGLHVSVIGEGPFAGQWALHYPDVQKIVLQSWQGICPRFDALSFGVGSEWGPLPGASSLDLCRPLMTQDDLCQSDPTKAGCRPKPPLAAAGQGPDPARYSVENLEKIDVEKGIYGLARVSTDARLEFRARDVTVPDAKTNTEWCLQRFSAVGRTIGDRRNDACILTPTPAQPKEGLLTCAVTVGFDRAQTYMEKICNVVAIFQGDTEDIVRLQVLKR